MFKSFFMGGFECSSHRRRDGKRLDLLASSGHAQFAAQDYRALAEIGIFAARDGLRWYQIEAAPGRYDWSGFLPMLRAARDCGVDVVWDLCHYGWPDHIDIWSAEFVDRFARFSAAAARLVVAETGRAPFFCPVNEISFWSWAGGEVGRINPMLLGRGSGLKRQLARASIAAVQAVRAEHSEARFLHAEPAIHIDGGLGSPAHRLAAESYRLSQFEAYDLICGDLEPELGGSPEHLDVVGINFYPDNQWYHQASTIPLGHHAFKPFSAILKEAYQRYGRPLMVAETGAEGSARSAWLHYMVGEVEAAIRAGVPVEALCLYPITDCPGWDDDRMRPIGLFSAPDGEGSRQLDPTLARELAAHRTRLAELHRRHPNSRSGHSDVPIAPAVRNPAGEQHDQTWNAAG